ncbi:class II fructose-bisphosphate aldolase [Marinomonas mediterranea]|uniref:class II fructose-bisphosphate aldolase n=1 Tax=Marinomonas mediterranea TaxID=119864 RepID=UPI00234A3E44|nr:class II fructose-bisphosphate aldolase [Marinomonas mediterranea]WCN09350.1 fructose-bisphosphate aldolase [Marinomonas mediterranea]
MLVNLNELLPAAANGQYAIPCFNVFGFEEGKAIVSAAESLSAPVILAANKDMVEFMGVKAVANMLVNLAELSKVPICVHLDHTYEEETIFKAMHCGFTSVMFDGSQCALEDNIRRTKNVVDVAHALEVSVEGEIGSVAYHEGRDHIKSVKTDPIEAKRFAEESGVDAMAIAIGNVHRLNFPNSVIDYALLNDITREAPNIPLVIHGTTGIREEDITRLKAGRISKFNVGTSLRQVMGHNLRRLINEEPDKFDKLYFMTKAMSYVEAEAKRIIGLMSATSY